MHNVPERFGKPIGFGHIAPADHYLIAEDLLNNHAELLLERSYLKSKKERKNLAKALKDLRSVAQIHATLSNFNEITFISEDLLEENDTEKQPESGGRPDGLTTVNEGSQRKPAGEGTSNRPGTRMAHEKLTDFSVWLSEIEDLEQSDLKSFSDFAQWMFQQKELDVFVPDEAVQMYVDSQVEEPAGTDDEPGNK